MSCNGCRVLRKGCSEGCVLRSCLQWIDSPESQGNATLFLAKFFGRSDLLSFISAVPDHQRPALFQSLLFEACGRTINPVGGAVGLLSSGNWHVCQAAAETVISGGVLRPIPGIDITGNQTAGSNVDESSAVTDGWMTQNFQYTSLPSVYEAREYKLSDLGLCVSPNSNTKIVAGRGIEKRRSLDSEESLMTSFGSGGSGGGDRRKERKLLNLFI